jgi:hypothetical protein
MTQKHYLILGIIAAIGITVLVFYIQQSTTIPSSISPGIISTLSIPKAPALGETAEITLSVISPRTTGNNVLVQIKLPEGFELVSGDINWSGVLKENEEFQLKAIIKAIEIGKWTIFGGAPGLGDYLYISVSEDSAYISEEPFPTSPRGKEYAEPSKGSIEPTEPHIQIAPEEPVEP